MIDQRHKHVTYGSSFKDFFKGFVDFTGYSSVPGHWFPVGSILGGFILLAVLVFQGVLSSFSSIGRRSTSDFGYLLGGSAFSDGVSTLQTGLAFGIFMLIAGLILILPLTASFTRRLRDVGFATWGIVILIALYYILSYFTVYLLTPVYCIVFLFVLMSLPSNAVETNSNSEFAKFFLRQTIQAQQYYSQFGNLFGHPVQFDQFGNPIQNQPYFNNGINPGFQGQPQGFNPNAQQGRPNPGFQGQPQGFNPNVPQGGQQGQGFNPNAPQGGQQNPGFNVNEVQGQQQQAPEVKEVEEVAVEQPNVEVAPQVEVTQVEEVTPQVEVAPAIEEIHEVKVEAVGGTRSKRLQKLNKAEEEVGFKKRR